MNFQLPILGVSALFLTFVLLLAIRYLKKEEISIWFAIPILAGFLPVSYVDRHFQSLPQIVAWSPFFLVLIAAVVIVLDRRSIPRIPIRLIVFYIFLFVTAIISSLLNHRPVLDLIYAQRGFFVLFALVIIIGRFRNQISTDKLFAILVWGGLVNAIVAIGQRVFAVTIFRLGSGDLVSGLFATDGEFLFYQLTSLIVILSYWFYQKRVINLPNSVAITLVLASIAIANNKAAWGFVALIFLAIGVFSGFKLLWRNMAPLIGVTLLGFMGYAVFDYVYVDSYQRSYKTEMGVASYVVDTDFINDYFFGDGTVNSKFSKGGTLKRGSALTFAYDHLEETEFGLVLGKGPGTTTKFTFGDELGYFERKFPGYKVGRTSLSMYWAELGLSGVCLLVLLAFVVYLTSFKAIVPSHRLISRTVALLFIGYLAYDSLLQEISAMFILATLIQPYSLGFTHTENEQTSLVSKN